MAITTNDIIKIVARLTHSVSGAIQGTFYADVTNTNLQNQLQIRAAIARYIEDIYIPINVNMVNRISYQDILIYNLTAATTEPAETWPTLTTGANALDGLPGGCTVMMRSNTNVQRREGRKYFPPPGQALQNDGVIETTPLGLYATALSNWTEDYVDGTNGVELNPGVVRALPPLSFTPFQNDIISNVIDYQRRRKAGVGI